MKRMDVSPPNDDSSHRTHSPSAGGEPSVSFVLPEFSAVDSLKLSTALAVCGYVSFRAQANHLGAPFGYTLGFERYLMEAYHFAQTVVILPLLALPFLAVVAISYEHARKQPLEDAAPLIVIGPARAECRLRPPLSPHARRRTPALPARTAGRTGTNVEYYKA